MLTYLLIPFFIVLVIYQIIHAMNVVEGFQDNSSTSTSPLIPSTPMPEKKYSPYDDNQQVLPFKNAGNIEVLNGRVSKLEEMVPEVKKLADNVDQLSKQVQAIATSKMNPVVDAGKKAKPITGL
jgi:hypothetical protein